ncbi:hypothetical protein [Lysinibacillus xylanilyticus]|uniref:hypothetical protein n=1 Tax=Lysinibacillus xylanilyticus TaxID=582475 RepID=UPI003D04DFD1
MKWLIGVEAGRLLGDHSVTDETLQRSEAAHRTPPGKRPAGTEINLTFCRRVLLYLNDTLVLLKLSFSTK